MYIQLSLHVPVIMVDFHIDLGMRLTAAKVSWTIQLKEIMYDGRKRYKKYALKYACMGHIIEFMLSTWTCLQSHMRFCSI